MTGKSLSRFGSLDINCFSLLQNDFLPNEEPNRESITLRLPTCLLNYQAAPSLIENLKAILKKINGFYISAFQSCSNVEVNLISKGIVPKGMSHAV